MKLKVNTLFYVEGDSKEIGIEDYNVRVSSPGIVLVDSPKENKMAIVCLDSIDGDHNVCVAIKKEYIRLI